MMRLWAMLGTLVLGAAGCELAYDPDVGVLHAVPPDSGDVITSDCGDSDPATPVSFGKDLRPLFTRSPGGCMFCHGTSLVSGFSIGTYENLRRGGVTAGAQVVIPGKPCESVLVKKLGPIPPFGARMPYNSGGSSYFTPAELALVSDWIAEGALNN